MAYPLMKTELFYFQLSFVEMKNCNQKQRNILLLLLLLMLLLLLHLGEI
jgi:hypothetical protein